VLCFFAERNNFGHPVGDNTLQHHYKLKTAADTVPYFTGNSLGALSDTHQPQIFRTRAICGDIIASNLQRCSAGTDWRDSQNFYVD